ncbi:MAG TPA: WecB/TagA/CpsF family glycosyltransferase [Anaeromyxobacteraceae bacterium]|nr:WecB/TagA/CpsF family glycosyltransferase [Anaeromyxobacteraceae bacterium]
MHPESPRRLDLGPLGVDPLTLGGALDRIEALVASGRGGRVFTPNVDHVVIAERHAEFREAYRDADLSLADGVPILWAARLLGEPLPQKVSGSDLVLPLVERAAARGWRVYLVGAAPGVAAEAARRLQQRFPALRVAGVDAPFVKVDGPDPEGEVALQRLAAAAPDLVLVAFGAPKQELWMHRHRAAFGRAVAVGVGASLDFVAGTIRRAPRWMQRAGLEWAFRLLREPRRLWRRYLVDDRRFVPIVWRALRARRRPR